MKNKKTLATVLCLVLVAAVLLVCALTVKAPETHTCRDCGGEAGVVESCETCGGTGVVESTSRYEETFVSLLPPVIAIALALITKEVYSSLFLGIVVGALLSADYNFSGTMDAIVNNALITSISDNAGILIFLVILGMIVILVNRAGGSRAFGNWAKTHIKTKAGALLATFALGVIIFIDDYFNCLTVGSVMRPLTDAHGISREKLAYLIDSTAAPVCMIAPISSWAAAVSQYAEDGQGLKLFVAAIPFNFYSLLTLVFIVVLSVLGFDYGKMALAEEAPMANALNEGDDEEPLTTKGKVCDLIIPIVILVVTCVIGLIYCGGFFDAESGNYLNFITAFADTDATVGLPWGAIISLILIIAYMIARKLLTFEDTMNAIPGGFKAMVPAILILTFATSLKNITVGMLGAKYFVGNLMSGAAAGLSMFLPAVIFLVACGLSFAIGTSWGTFGILIPIVCAIFPAADPHLIVGISACLAGAVCGDHCSPISDTTIMSSAGARCNHVEHVATQIPYAVSVAVISFIMFIIAGIIPNAWICLPIAVVLTVAFLLVMKAISKKKAK